MMALRVLWLGLCAVAASSAPTPSDLLQAARGLEQTIVRIRRDLHAIPELAFEEVKTSEAIRRQLELLKIPFRYPVAKTGIVGTIGTGKPIVALRSDIDALPVVEDEGHAVKSQHVGRMHACGHDGHMSMLLGAAQILKRYESELQGTVKLIFQPAEEGGAGADVMINEGALEGVSAAFGMHVLPTLPTGVIATRVGTIMAGAVSFTATFTGRGGHAAIPHLNADPVVAAAAAVGALQTLVSRETSPLGSAVVSVTMLRAGDAFNVIPDDATISGTIRALSSDQMDSLRARVPAMLASLAAAYGCNASLDWRLAEQPYYPPTVNDISAVALAREVAQRLLGDSSRVLEAEPLMAGEDFAFFGRAVPSAFLFLGIRNESAGSIHGLHNAKFTLDESALTTGAALHAALAVEYLQRHSSASGREEL